MIANISDRIKFVQVQANIIKIANYIKKEFFSEIQKGLQQTYQMDQISITTFPKILQKIKLKIRFLCSAQKFRDFRNHYKF